MVYNWEHKRCLKIYELLGLKTKEAEEVEFMQ